ncbi:hypothetical protein RFL00_04650 [Streptococcus suis]|uniref:hypothetical protein n=1 Tax=Streptococcus suis TaxID=1307 RepID=UPI002FC80540
MEDRKMTQTKKLLTEADAIVIGAGAGLSSAAGLTYSGQRFEEHFAPFIKAYGLTDMYSAGFYPFTTEEKKWGLLEPAPLPQSLSDRQFATLSGFV